MTKIILASLCGILIWSGQTYAACFPSMSITTPTSDFVVNGNGTVTHTKTGLMWKRCSEGQVWFANTCTGIATTYTWQGALLQAQAVNGGIGFAGFFDWRVPNLKELSSITELQCVSPPINLTIFPATVNNDYWTASSYAGLAPFVNAPSGAWSVNFSGGGGYGRLSKSNNFYVRLVRGGQ